MVGEDYKVSAQYTFRVPLRDAAAPTVLQSGKSPSVIVYKPDGTLEASPPAASELGSSGIYSFAYTFPAAAGAYTFVVSATGIVPVPWTVQVRSNSRTDLAVAATALTNATWTDAKAGYVDAAVSGRATPADILATPANKLAVDVSGRVTVGANADKVSYSLAPDQSGVTVGTANALGTQAKADVNAQADLALGDYGAAKPADVRAQADAALASYDGATGADVTSAVAPLATASALTAQGAKVDAVKAKTDNLPAHPAASGDAMALTSDERAAVAEAVLDEPVQGATATADSLRAAAKAAWAQGFGKWALNGTVLRLYGPDGTTVVRQFDIDSAETPTERVPA